MCVSGDGLPKALGEDDAHARCVILDQNRATSSNRRRLGRASSTSTVVDGIDRDSTIGFCCSSQRALDKYGKTNDDVGSVRRQWP